MFKVMAIKIEPRDCAAPKVQEVLTKYGCIIQTRLGLHETGDNFCSNAGLIILNLVSNKEEEIKQLSSDLNSIDGATAKVIEI